MRKVFVIIFFFILFSSTVFPQQVKTEKIAVPDSLFVLCEKLFLKDAGQKVYNTCIKTDSAKGFVSTWPDGQQRQDFTFYFTFSYPGVKYATFPLQIYYRYFSGKGYFQSGRFLRINKTDLPQTIKSDGIMLVPFDKICKIASESDSTVHNSVPVFVLGSDYFYWHFSFSYPDPNSQGDALMILSDNVIINPYTGKVINKYKASK